MNIPRFWMVQGEGCGPARVKHTSKHMAIAEAKRLAQENPDISFYVLETIGVAKVVQPAQYIDFQDDIPF